MINAIVVTSHHQLKDARRLKTALKQAAIFAPSVVASGEATLSGVRASSGMGASSGLASTEATQDTIGYQSLAACLKALFKTSKALVVFASTGIVIRSLAGVVKNKKLEPAVTAIVGESVIPLLGAQSAGGLRQARTIAAALRLKLVATTATTATFGVDLENPPQGWQLLNQNHYKAFATKLLRHKKVNLGDAPLWLRNPQDTQNHPPQSQSPQSQLLHSRRASLSITTRIPKTFSPNQLVYGEQNLALGIGCIKNCPPQKLESFVINTLTAHNINPQTISGVFSIHQKIGEEAIYHLATRLGVRAKFFTPEVLQKVIQTSEISHRSQEALKAVGVESVCEAAVLAAAGKGSKLLVTKQKTAYATMAVARQVGKSAPTTEGVLYVIGLGAGGEGDITIKAAQALASCDAVVGYEPYTAQAKAFTTAKIYPYKLGEEKLRVLKALSLAQANQTVGLVCSGDAGIYGMASLAVETIAQKQLYIRLKVLGGVTAMSEAAAKSGGILGHDFAAISLSNLLTQEQVILERIKSAAKAGFVMGLYNPTSKTRHKVYAKALKTLQAHLSPQTPVVVAKHISRPKQSITVATLEELPKLAVDMHTTILVGNHTTKTHRGRVYTPRGYEK